MRKIIISSIVLFVFGITNAQKNVIFGVKSGINISVLTDDLSRANGRIGFVLGSFVELRLFEKFSLQPEVVYSSQGAQYREYTYSGFSETYNNTRINLMYIVVPIIAKYYVVDGISLEFGPQVNFLAGAKLNYDSYSYVAGIDIFSGGSRDIKEYTEPIDYGLNFGGSFEITDEVLFNVRYTLGLENVLSNPAGFNFSSKNSILCFTVGYKF
jgi:hypothetical protein